MHLVSFCMSCIAINYLNTLKHIVDKTFTFGIKCTVSQKLLKWFYCKHLLCTNIHF